MMILALGLWFSTVGGGRHQKLSGQSEGETLKARREGSLAGNPIRPAGVGILGHGIQ